jgi:hypothetical protein
VAKYSSEYSTRPQRVPLAPEPPSADAHAGMETARTLARRFLPAGIHLWAAVAFGDSEASLWTRVQCARLLAQVAGAIPQAVPEAPGPHDEDGGGEQS